ncbi:MAG: DUF3667 domain-containing protein [Saprospiraceae bacterium]|jgi:hypothetical protein
MTEINSTETANAELRCQACQAKMKGKFCRKCGEKKFKSSDLSLKKLGWEFWIKITHVDNRFWKTVFALFFRPGALTRAYCAGIRKAYLKPIQLFFIANLLYFLSLNFFKNDVFYYALENFIKYHPLGLDYETWAQNAALEKGLEWELFSESFNAQMQTQVKTWIILNVPLLGLLLMVLFANQKRYLVEHMVFSMHYYAFIMLYIVALSVFGTGLFYLQEWFGLPAWVRGLIEVLALFIFIYLALAIRGYYRATWVGTVARLVVLYFGIILILNIYRVLMFWVSLAMV